jgi:hypothetical protein
LETVLRTPVTEEIVRKVRNYDYIPWNESAKLMHTLFGPFGWDSETIEIVQVEDMGFRATVRVTYRVTDDDGNTITTFHDGVGFGKLEHTNAGDPLADTAIKTAASDGFSRAVKYIGEALGLNLYDKDDPANATAPAPARSNGNARPQAGGARRKTATETMVNSLKWRKVPEDVIERVREDFDTTSTLIGLLKGGKPVYTALEEMGLVEEAF